MRFKNDFRHNYIQFNSFYSRYEITSTWYIYNREERELTNYGIGQNLELLPGSEKQVAMIEYTQLIKWIHIALRPITV